MEKKDTNFKEEVLKTGATIAAYERLLDNEYESIDELAGLSPQDYIQMGIKGKSARTLAEAFNDSEDEELTEKQLPMKVEVSMPKTFDQMGTVELLTVLMTESNNADALSALLARPDVVLATSKTNNWGISPKGNLDAELTAAFIRYLGKPGSTVQRMYKGQRPKNIHVILGIIEKSLINPFNENELLVEELDSFGNDWSKVDRNLMRAILWARTTRHSFIPPNLDPFSAFENITSDPLPRRWSEILIDFEAAVEEGDPEATMINLSRKPEVMDQQKKPNSPHDEGITSDSHGASWEDVKDLGKRMFQGQQDSAEESVRKRCLGDIDVDSMDSQVNGVFTNVKIDCMDCKIKAIVLKSFRCSCMDIEGNLWLAPGASIKSSTMDSSLKIRRASWEELESLVKKW